MNVRPQTIEIFLPDGNPRGVRIADMLSRTVKAVLFPRNQFEYILKRDELANVGFYFLFGKAEDGSDLAYIGEAEDCAKRLKDHQQKKDFWNYAIAIVSKTNSLTKTHVKFLEYYSIQKAKEASRYKFENSVDPSRPYVTESMEAEMIDCFETTKIYLSTLGFPLFDSISREVITHTSTDVFILKGNDMKAEGNMTNEGFVVFKGSQIHKKAGTSLNSSHLNLIEQLKQNCIISNNIFNKDYIFSSPSTAATILLGRSSNGWIQWKNKEGKTLDEVKRKVE